ncbi:MAG TPA: Mur ligase family protein, partial [Bacteroidota bacterium]|nr:Mur ligase family protein [Bacteroidota bacterium]
NHAGEIAYLCDILTPTHGMITNIGREHFEFFGNIDGVANAEAELFSAIAKSGTGFINTDDERVVRHAKKIKKKMTYGFTKYSNIVRGTFRTMTNNGCAEFSVRMREKKPFDIHLSVPGKHAMANALAAATVGLAFEIPQKKIQQALRKFHAVGKRMEVLRIGGVTILNDTYNANPDSVLSALETLSAMKCRGKKIVVLADMLELGSAAQEEHARIGDIISTKKFDYLFTFGEFSRSIHDCARVNMKIHYDQKNILSEFVFELLAPGDAVLVKGSRGMKMEDVVTFLTQRLRKDAR